MEKKIIVGIQGGEGSFNEEALEFYSQKNLARKRANVLEGEYEVKYLYTSEGVLQTLIRGEIDLGQFAFFNSIGGLVIESAEAMNRYGGDFMVEDVFEIPINHCLLAVDGVGIDNIDTIMSHPHALKQCQATLAEKYPSKSQISGDGHLIDQATAAKCLAEGGISPKTAVLASSVCAQKYGLAILDSGLQDKKENVTTFIIVKARKVGMLFSD